MHPGSCWQSGEMWDEGWQHRSELGRADKPPVILPILTVSPLSTSVPAPSTLDVTTAQDGSAEEPAGGMTDLTSQLLTHSPGSRLELHPQPCVSPKPQDLNVQPRLDQ